MLAQKIDVKQKTKEWLEIRKQYLTASDVVAFIRFLKGTTHYGTPSQWFEKKFEGGEEKHNSFNKMAMRNGELNEHSIVGKYFANTDKYAHGEVFVKDFLLASLDVRDIAANTIGEIKFCTGGETSTAYIEYANKIHRNFYQLCAQMYILDADKGTMIVTCEDKIGETPLLVQITRQDPIFIEFMEALPKLKEMWERAKSGDKDFLGSRDIVSPIQRDTDTIVELKEKIKTIKRTVDILEERVRLAIENDAESGYVVDADGTPKMWVVQMIERKTKTLKEDIKEEDVYDYTTKEINTLKLINR